MDKFLFVHADLIAKQICFAIFLYILAFFAKDNHMNQILSINNKIQIKGYHKPIIEIKKGQIVKIKFFYKILFIISIFIITICTLYFIYEWIDKGNKAKLSDILSESFNISTLYSYNNSYNANPTNTYNTDHDFSVIGIIEINKIKVNYPILSHISDELLKISTCRFYGPTPNEVGNLCIAGHNYNDNRFFSKIGQLKNGDIIKLYDAKRN